jgi:hypothetical protein
MDPYWCHGCETSILLSANSKICPLCGSEFIEEIGENDSDVPSYEEMYSAGSNSEEDLEGPYDHSEEEEEQGEVEVEEEEEGGEEDNDDNEDIDDNTTRDDINSNRSQSRPYLRQRTSILTANMGDGTILHQLQVWIGQIAEGRGGVIQVTTRGGDDGRDNNAGLTLLTGLMPLIRGWMTGDHVEGAVGDYVFSQEGMDAVLAQLMEQEAMRRAPPPAPDHVINSLPRFPMKERILEKGMKKYEECAICKEEFQMEDRGLGLPCQHVYHEDCIIMWVKRHGTCPVCRLSLTTTATSLD